MNIRTLVSQMTLEEKAGITSGQNNWFTKAIFRLGIPAVRTSDGPHGLRTQSGEQTAIAEGTSTTAVCYPAACATAASFDRDLLHRLGEALGQECQSLGVDVLLGPGINMKRSPLCGRNFEYFSEDPYLAGELGSAFVNGVQSQGVGTSLKHFFANSQEFRRMDSSSEMDERTMREIYLPAFESVVEQAQPWTIMAAYNKIDGVHATANKMALTDILRNEWGFRGVVTSDWGATHNRLAAIAAGCDLTMPAEDTDGIIVDAVRTGDLDESLLDACVERLLKLAFKAAEHRKTGMEFPYEKHHMLARELAGESIVLLKNNGILPLAKDVKTAFIGAFAEKPRYQGGGSSHINPFQVVGAVEAARSAGKAVVYEEGYDPLSGEASPEQIAAAAKLAKEAQAAVVFVGLPDCMESEGFDRQHMRLPESQNDLIVAVCRANPNTVVVLHNGSPVEMPWVDRPKAILEAYLGGEAVGEAVADVLYGDKNPSGRLAETFPKRLEDTPCYLYYHGEDGIVGYQEGLFVGYRYYESKKAEVLFPFGYGLSYTDFEYSNLVLDRSEMEDADTLNVCVDVTNTGKMAGKAVVQLYVAPDKMAAIRPVRELKDFAKVALKPGETKTVAFTLKFRAFAHWSKSVHNWRVEQGGYAIQIGSDAHTMILTKKVIIHAEPIPPAGGYGLSSPMDIIAKTRKGREFLNNKLKYLFKGLVSAGFMPQEFEMVLDSIPGGITLDTLSVFASHISQATGTSEGMDTLLAQPIAMLGDFLPSEQKPELGQLFNLLNA